MLFFLSSSHQKCGAVSNNSRRLRKVGLVLGIGSPSSGHVLNEDEGRLVPNISVCPVWRSVLIYLISFIRNCPWREREREREWMDLGQFFGQNNSWASGWQEEASSPPRHTTLVIYYSWRKRSLMTTVVRGDDYWIKEGSTKFRQIVFCSK